MSTNFPFQDVIEEAIAASEPIKQLTRAETQRLRRARQAVERRAARAGNRLLFRGPVDCYEFLMSVHGQGKEVRTSHRQTCLRIPLTGAVMVDGVPVVGPRHIIVLADHRADFSRAMAEVIDTGFDVRMHIWRGHPDAPTRVLAVQG
jgi:hypothetical protein